MATEKLSDWVANLQWEHIPKEVTERAKYLILDALTCGLVGARLPWSDQALDAVASMESGGNCKLIGHSDRKLPPLAAALINSTFVQSFELDDYHQRAPLHSGSILVPALLSIASQDETISGQDFLTAIIAGFEVGPRVGLALNGGHILSRGWHSGAVFGPAASAASTARLLKLNKGQIENAFGMACTQACGLMSAQFESSAKRMQHGFAARNGLFSSLMAQKNYKGIAQVFERGYGGYLNVFTLGGDPPKVEALTNELGSDWETMNINIKWWACMGGNQAVVDCVNNLKDQIKSVGDIDQIVMETTTPLYHHGMWKAEKPLTEIGAQMNAAYIAACVLVDGDLTVQHFSRESMDREDLWELIEKTEGKEADFTSDGYPTASYGMCTRMKITMKDGQTITTTVPRPTGVRTPITNEQLVEKFIHYTSPIMTKDQQDAVINRVRNLESIPASKLIDAITIEVKNAMAA